MDLVFHVHGVRAVVGIMYRAGLEIRVSERRILRFQHLQVAVFAAAAVDFLLAGGEQGQELLFREFLCADDADAVDEVGVALLHHEFHVDQLGIVLVFGHDHVGYFEVEVAFLPVEFAQTDLVARDEILVIKPEVRRQSQKGPGHEREPLGAAHEIARFQQVLHLGRFVDLHPFELDVVDAHAQVFGDVEDHLHAVVAVGLQRRIDLGVRVAFFIVELPQFAGGFDQQRVVQRHVRVELHELHQFVVAELAVALDRNLGHVFLRGDIENDFFVSVGQVFDLGINIGEHAEREETAHVLVHDAFGVRHAGLRLCVHLEDVFGERIRSLLQEDDPVDALTERGRGNQHCQHCHKPFVFHDSFSEGYVNVFSGFRLLFHVGRDVLFAVFMGDRTEFHEAREEVHLHLAGLSVSVFFN